MQRSLIAASGNEGPPHPRLISHPTSAAGNSPGTRRSEIDRSETWPRKVHPSIAPACDSHHEPQSKPLPLYTSNFTSAVIPPPYRKRIDPDPQWANPQTPPQRMVIEDHTAQHVGSSHDPNLWIS